MLKQWEKNEREGWLRLLYNALLKDGEFQHSVEEAYDLTKGAVNIHTFVVMEKMHESKFRCPYCRKPLLLMIETEKMRFECPLKRPEGIPGCGFRSKYYNSVKKLLQVHRRLQEAEG